MDVESVPTLSLRVSLQRMTSWSGKTTTRKARKASKKMITITNRAMKMAVKRKEVDAVTDDHASVGAGETTPWCWIVHLSMSVSNPLLGFRSTNRL